MKNFKCYEHRNQRILYFRHRYLWHLKKFMDKTVKVLEAWNWVLQFTTSIFIYQIWKFKYRAQEPCSIILLQGLVSLKSCDWDHWLHALLTIDASCNCTKMKSPRIIAKISFAHVAISLKTLQWICNNVVNIWDKCYYLQSPCHVTQTD